MVCFSVVLEGIKVNLIFYPIAFTSLPSLEPNGHISKQTNYLLMVAKVCDCTEMFVSMSAPGRCRLYRMEVIDSMDPLDWISSITIDFDYMPVSHYPILHCGLPEQVLLFPIEGP